MPAKKSITVTFSDYQAGDWAWFERTFSREAFDAFSQLSSDTNPLHHDRNYAWRSGYDDTIMPMHLTAAPLSAVAGMIFPGEASLYLSHKVRAVRPARYEVPVVYSARIESLSPGNRIFSVSCAAFQAGLPVLSADLQVQARSDTWNGSRPDFFRMGPRSRTVVVTGASGAIGGAIARAFCSQGWNLILSGRNTKRLQELRTSLLAARSNVSVVTVAGDLSDPNGVAALADVIRKCDDLAALVHAASPPIESSPATHSAIACEALASLAAAALPTMQRRQEGVILAIGSAAIANPQPRWEPYAAGKRALLDLINRVDREQGEFGVRALTLAPGYVCTDFSRAWFNPQTPGLLPEEVAEKAMALVAAPPLQSFCVLLASEADMFAGESSEGGAAPANSSVQKGDSVERQASLSSLVRRILAMPPDADIEKAALGETAQWDSLKQIELVIAVERAFGITFSVQEIEAARSYAALSNLLQEKVPQRA